MILGQNLLGYTDLTAFGKCLGKDVTYVEKVWNNVYGKFDKAILHLVVDVLRETKNAGEGIEERLSSALMRMEDTDSALYAAKAVEKGLFYYSQNISSENFVYLTFACYLSSNNYIK